MRISRILLVACTVWSFAAAAPAQVVSRVVDSKFSRALSEIVRTSPDAGSALPRLEVLSRQPDLSIEQRMQVDSLRIGALGALKRHLEALAIAEAIVDARPDLPDGYLILANAAFDAEDFAATAMAVMAASLKQPDIVNQLPPYEIMVVTNQLKSASQRELAAAFGQRLFDAGWDNGRIGQRSSMALDVIRSLLDKGLAGEAARYLPLIASPNSYTAMLADKRYSSIRQAAEDWAGTRLEKQWPIYLDTTRRAWLADRSPEAAADYVIALELAGHNRTIVTTFLPELQRKFDPNTDDLWIFVVPPVTSALATLGRWDEAFALLDRVALTWPPGWAANSLNISGNRARLRLFNGNFEAAERLFGEVRKEAEPFAVQVTAQNMAFYRGYQLCAQHQMGGADPLAELDQLSAQWGQEEPARFAWFYACLGKRERALKTLIAALQNENGRGQVVSFMQPRSDTALDSEFAREMDEVLDSLSRDPALIEAAKPFAERRSWRLRDSAPPEGS